MASPRVRFASKAALRRLAVVFVVLVAILVAAYITMIRMPGRPHTGPLPPITPDQLALAADLRSWVTALCTSPDGGARPGNRSTFQPRHLAAAAAWISDQLQSFGYETVVEYPVARGSPAPTFEITIPGTSRPDEIVVVGAHYDAFQGTPGADDNASGVAACLHLARHFQGKPLPRTLRVLFFVNEEPPAFWTDDMGSLVYARACRARNDNIVAMLSIESIGYYSDQPGSQKYPPPLNLFYPTTGDFIAFVSNVSSRHLNKRALAIFRETTPFPAHGASPPGYLPGVGWSDHWAFWQVGYPAIMLTDTAPFRNPHYHRSTDTPDTLDYERTARVTEGIVTVVQILASK